MRAQFVTCLLLPILIGIEGLPTGSTSVKEKINVKPTHEITAERVLHLGQGINRKVRQHDPLSSSNSDGDMQLATQFRSKRSASLNVDFQQANLSPYASYYGQGSTSANQLLQPIYYPQSQNDYLQQYSTQYAIQGNDASNLAYSYGYYSNPQIDQHYYDPNQLNAYINTQNLNAYSHSQLNYGVPQQYYYYQPQYSQQSVVYEPQPVPYVQPSQHNFYYQPMEDNTIWDTNSYPAQSSHAQLERNGHIVDPNGNGQNVLQTDTQIGTLGYWNTPDVNALTAVGEDVQDVGNHGDVVAYHELIDVLYNENNLSNELHTSSECCDEEEMG